MLTALIGAEQVGMMSRRPSDIGRARGFARCAGAGRATIRRGRSRSWCRSPPAAARTCWRGSWRSISKRSSASRSSSRTGPAPARRLPPWRRCAPMPDGYTLMQATSSTMAINVTMSKKLPYEPLKDLVPVALYSSSPFFLVVSNEFADQVGEGPDRRRQGQAERPELRLRRPGLDASSQHRAAAES